MGDWVPPARTETPRQVLRRVLADGTPRSVPELSQVAHLSQRDVADVLDQLCVAGVAVETLPPDCQSCGFVFTDRKKARRPSRCPRCRKGRIRAARFWIEGPTAE